MKYIAQSCYESHRQSVVDMKTSIEQFVKGLQFGGDNSVADELVHDGDGVLRCYDRMNLRLNARH